MKVADQEACRQILPSLQLHASLACFSYQLSNTAADLQCFGVEPKPEATLVMGSVAASEMTEKTADLIAENTFNAWWQMLDRKGCDGNGWSCRTGGSQPSREGT